MRKRWITAGISLLFLASVLPAAALTPVEPKDTQTDGVTTVEWYSEFLVENYDCGPITVSEGDLGIEVPAGAAEFVTFLEKENKGKGKNNPITPVSTDKKPKAEGEITTSSEAEITFHRLHNDEESGLYKGTAHLWWEGMVDEDGEEGTESTAKYGVNVHVEAMANCGGV